MELWVVTSWFLTGQSQKSTLIFLFMVFYSILSM